MPVLWWLLIIATVVQFGLGAFSVRLGWWNPVAGGLLTLTLAVWLLPAVAPHM